MPRTANPYMADAGQYNGIGEGISNLANVFLNSQPDPVKSAQAQAAAWQGRERRENVQDTVDARRGRQDLGNLLRTFDPGADNRGMFATGVGTGSMEVGDIGKLFHMMQANFGGTDSQVGRSHVGTGGVIGTGDGFSLDDREGIRASDFSNDQALQGQKDAASMQRVQAALANNLARERIKRGGSGGTGDLGNMDWLGVTRQGDVRGDMVTEALNILGEMGLPYDAESEQYNTALLEQAAPGLFSEVLDNAWAEMQRDSVGGVPRRAPTSYVNESIRRRVGGLDYQAGEDNLVFPDKEERFEIRPPNPARVSFTQTPPPTQGDEGSQILRDAVDAVGKGADPNAVRERLYGMGYTDSQLSEVGL